MVNSSLYNKKTHLSSIKGTEADVSAEDLNSNPRSRNHPAAPQSETNTRPHLPSTNLQRQNGRLTDYMIYIYI